jgi:AcrR family transcriptional regulator
VRRDQIRRAAAAVVARRGFERATMRDVAALASVSTGMVNHYFRNREDLLIQTLEFVSERNQSRIRDEVSRYDSGPERVRALVRSALFVESTDFDDANRVWVAALAHALHSEATRQVIAERRRLFQSLIKDVLRSLGEPALSAEPALTGLAAEIDAYLHGVAIHVATGETRLDLSAVEASFMRLVQSWPRE